MRRQHVSLPDLIDRLGAPTALLSFSLDGPPDSNQRAFIKMCKDCDVDGLTNNLLDLFYFDHDETETGINRDDLRGFINSRLTAKGAMRNADKLKNAYLLTLISIIQMKKEALAGSALSEHAQYSALSSKDLLHHL